MNLKDRCSLEATECRVAGLTHAAKVIDDLSAIIDSARPFMEDNQAWMSAYRDLAYNGWGRRRDETWERRVLGWFAKEDLHSSLFWGTDANFYVNANDLFLWACSDFVELTRSNFDDLVDAVEECKRRAPRDCLNAIYGCELFCCRVRGMRPQGCCYPESRELWPLFDECGPERPVGIGNPYAPGEKVKG